MKIRISLRRLKKVLSVVGATVLLGTFLAKETRKDKLKELADSIDAGENNYIIREQNRTMFAELKRFEAEFVEFRKDPTRPKPDLSGFGAGSGGGWVDPGEVDSEMLNSIADRRRENQEILDNVIQLANKLSTPSGSDQLKLRPINGGWPCLSDPALLSRSETVGARPCVLCKGGNDAADSIGLLCLPDCIAPTALTTCTLSPAPAIDDSHSSILQTHATASWKFSNKRGDVTALSWSDMWQCRSTSTCC